MAQCGLAAKPKSKYSVNNNLKCSPSQLSATKPHRELSTTIFSFSPGHTLDRIPQNNTSSLSQTNARLNHSQQNIYKHAHDTKSGLRHGNQSASIASRKSKNYELNCTHMHDHDHSNPELTFKPFINEMPHSIYSTHDCKKIKASRESTRQKLIEDMTSKIRDRISSRIKLEEQKSKKDCTFHPYVTPFMNDSSQQPRMPVFDKLFKQAEQIQESKLQAQQQKKQKQQQQIQQMLNWKLNNPDLNKTKVLNTQKHNLAPIHTRIEQLVEEKLKNRRELQQKYEAQMKNIYKFQPTICSNSERLADNRASKINKQQNKSQELVKYKEDVVERLYKQYKISKHKKEELERVAREQEELFCTFRPSINTGVNQARNRDYRPLYSDRQYNRGTGYETSRMCRNQEPCRSFMPKIDRLSDLIVMHTRGPQSQQQQLHRLSVQPSIDKSHNIALLTDELYQQLTFAPAINAISASPNIHPRPHHHACPAPTEQQPSFHPCINPRSKLIRPRSAIQHASRMAKIKQDQLKYQMQQEYELMKQCSFQPKVNNKRHHGSKGKGVIDVEGMDKFMFWRDKARSLTQQQQLRQQSVFHLEHRYDQRMQSKNE